MRRSLLIIAVCILAGSTIAPTSSVRAQFKETPQSHLEFGLNTYRDGFYEPAIDAFRAYLKAAGNSKAAWIVRYLLAEALRRDGRLKEAIAAYQAFLSRHPRHERAGEVQFRIGVLAERLGDEKAAIRAYSSVKRGRYRVEAVYRVAALRLAAREWRGAVASLDEFIKSAPRDPRVEDALFERAIALDHIPLIKEAEKAYSLVVRRYPRNPRAHAFRLRLAKIQLDLKKFGSAEKTFDSVFQGRPGEKKRADLRLGQAASLFAQKKYPEAGAAFEAVLKMELSKQQRRAAERGLASAWWRAGEYAKAAPAYRTPDPGAGQGRGPSPVFPAERGEGGTMRGGRRKISRFCARRPRQRRAAAVFFSIPAGGLPVWRGLEERGAESIQRTHPARPGHARGGMVRVAPGRGAGKRA